MKNNLYYNKGNGSLDSSVLGKSRVRKTSDQIQHLETFFQANQSIDGERLRELAQLTNLSDDQITGWFKKQRQKKKRKVDGADQQIAISNSNEEDGNITGYFSWLIFMSFELKSDAKLSNTIPQN